jgi:CHAT domain-containing protein
VTADRIELRAHAQRLVLQRRYAEARPLLAEAAEVYRAAVEDAIATGRSPVADVISLMFLVDHQLRCEFALGDYAALVRHLAEAVALRRDLSLGPAATSTWRRLLDEVGQLTAFDAHILAALADACEGPAAAAVAEGAALAAELASALAAMNRAPTTVEQLARACTALHGLLAGAVPRLGELTGAVLAHGFLGAPAPVRAGCQELTAMLRAPLDQDGYQRIQRLETAWERDVLAGVATESRRAVRAAKESACGLAASAARLEQQAAQLRALDLPTAARRVHDQNRAAVLALNNHVDNWRGLIEADWDRIQAMEDAQPFYRDLVATLYDLGVVDDAMAASEMARARSFSDLLAAGQPRARAVTPTGLREAIAAHGRPVVEYFLDGNRLLVFTAVPGGQTRVADTTLDVTALVGRIARFHELVKRHAVTPAELAELAELLRALGAALWDPVPGLAPDPGLPITVVPHGPLLRVPFAALLDGQGRYLVHRHPLVLLPAASILPELLARRSARRHPRSLCVLVDPEPMPDGLAPLTTLRAGLTRLVGAAPGPARLHPGPQASVRTLRAAGMAGHSVLCLASHAEAYSTDDGDPMDSYIALTPGDPLAPDGRLTAREIHRLDVDAELVLLAACETGAGRATSDGVVGLSRAFLSRRCGGVLMSLTKVGQDDTIRLIRMFLDAYTGCGAALALRNAQAELAEAYPDEPHRWAPFALLGLGE